AELLWKLTDPPRLRLQRTLHNIWLMAQPPLLCGFAQQIGEKAQIRNQHSPIANLEHPSTLSLAISRAAKLLIRLIVEGCSKLAIGECWLRIFGPSSSGAICCAKPGAPAYSRVAASPLRGS